MFRSFFVSRDVKNNEHNNAHQQRAAGCYRVENANHASYCTCGPSTMDRQ